MGINNPRLFDSLSSPKGGEGWGEVAFREKGKLNFSFWNLILAS
jgi:hypothetical protein